MTTGTCQHCARTKRLNGDGLVVTHYLSINISRKAIRTVGAGWVRRECAGSGKTPRGVER